MSHALKPKVEWQPSASWSVLRRRAQLLQHIRQFFAEREVIEVETPLLNPFTVTDVHTHSFAVFMSQQCYYLQTSPEYAMKRLLAAGSGCIYQISKAFRYDERGQSHNPEFTLLEWYRIGFNHYQLMDELDLLLQTVAFFPPAQRLSYHEFFLQHFAVDIFACCLKDLHHCLLTQQLEVVGLDQLGFDDCLQLLLNHQVEAQFESNLPLFIYDFPPAQSALAKIRDDTSPVAERFELYINGIEIANGFHELTDPKEQLARFIQDQAKRQQQALPVPNIDTHLIAALVQGLPDCAGVAVGIDRLMMALTQCKKIDEIMSFPWQQA